MQRGRRLPPWLKMQRARGENYSRLKRLVINNRLHTICTSGNCPNIGECWNSGTATFMILGDICTRACKFCATKTGKPLPPDPEEPARLAESIKELQLNHCVVTSVDRDDLPDGGASFWAETIRTIKSVNPGMTIEALIPDFDGNENSIQKIIDEGPDVVAHNIETVRRLTPLIRTKARYETSLNVLKIIFSKGMIAKSGFMLGLGEKQTEIEETITDIFDTGTTILTVGQYLQPTIHHMKTIEYIDPPTFKKYKELALNKGFEIVECDPLVRSSFHSEKHIIHG